MGKFCYLFVFKIVDVIGIGNKKKTISPFFVFFKILEQGPREDRLILKRHLHTDTHKQHKNWNYYLPLQHPSMFTENVMFNYTYSIERSPNWKNLNCVYLTHPACVQESVTVHYQNQSTDIHACAHIQYLTWMHNVYNCLSVWTLERTEEILYL